MVKIWRGAQHFQTKGQIGPLNVVFDFNYNADENDIATSLLK